MPRGVHTPIGDPTADDRQKDRLTELPDFPRHAFTSSDIDLHDGRYREKQPSQKCIRHSCVDNIFGRELWTHEFCALEHFRLTGRVAALNGPWSNHMFAYWFPGLLADGDYTGSKSSPVAHGRSRLPYEPRD